MPVKLTNPPIAVTERLIEYLHQHQKDWSGQPYHFHPMAVRDNLRKIPVYHSLNRDEQEVADHVALLHDTFEDVMLHRDTGEPVPPDHPMARPMRRYDLERRGYLPGVTNRVEALTRPAAFPRGDGVPERQRAKGEGYLDKIRLMVETRDIIVMLVKLGDNMHNADPQRRMNLPFERRLVAERMTEKRYVPSMTILKAGLGLD